MEGGGCGKPKCGLLEPRNKGQGVGEHALFIQLPPAFVQHGRGAGREQEEAPAWMGREVLQQGMGVKGVGRASQQVALPAGPEGTTASRRNCLPQGLG